MLPTHNDIHKSLPTELATLVLAELLCLMHSFDHFNHWNISNLNIILWQYSQLLIKLTLNILKFHLASYELTTVYNLKLLGKNFRKIG